MLQAGKPDALALAVRFLRRLSGEVSGAQHPETGAGNAAEYLQSQLGACGLKADVIEHEPGRPNLIARLAASGPAGDGALLLTTPLDPPTGAGRDPSDMAPAAVFAAIVAAAGAKDGDPNAGSRREIILALTTEGFGTGAQSGLAWFAANHLSAARPAGVLTCGGAPLRLMDKSYLAYVCAGFGRTVLRVAARGGARDDLDSLPAGQGRPVGDQHPIVMLARAIAELGRWESPVHVTPAFQQCVEAMASAQSPPESAHVRSLLNPLMTRDAAAHITGDLTSRALLMAQSSNSYVPVGLSAVCGEGGQVHSAETTIECRLLPGQSADSAQRELEDLFRARGLPLGGRDGCQLEISTSGELPSVESPAQSDLTRAMHRAMRRRRPGTALVPMMGECGAGVRSLRGLGIPVYGFFPATTEGGGTGTRLELAVSVLSEVLGSFAYSCLRPQGSSPV